MALLTSITAISIIDRYIYNNYPHHLGTVAKQFRGDNLVVTVKKICLWLLNSYFFLAAIFAMFSVAGFYFGDPGIIFFNAWVSIVLFVKGLKDE